MIHGYSPRIETLLDRLNTSDMTRDDFARLALACLDQWGMSARDQDALAARLGVSLTDEEESGWARERWAFDATEGMS